MTFRGLRQMPGSSKRWGCPRFWSNCMNQCTLGLLGCLRQIFDKSIREIWDLRSKLKKWPCLLFLVTTHWARSHPRSLGALLRSAEFGILPSPDVPSGPKEGPLAGRHSLSPDPLPETHDPSLGSVGLAHPSMWAHVTGTIAEHTLCAPKPSEAWPHSPARECHLSKEVTSGQSKGSAPGHCQEDRAGPVGVSC